MTLQSNKSFGLSNNQGTSHFVPEAKGLHINK